MLFIYLTFKFTHDGLGLKTGTICVDFIPRIGERLQGCS